MFGTAEQFQYAGGPAFSRVSNAVIAKLNCFQDSSYAYVNAIRSWNLFPIFPEFMWGVYPHNGSAVGHNEDSLEIKSQLLDSPPPDKLASTLWGGVPLEAR